MARSLAELYSLWDKFGDTPVKEGSDQIDAGFFHFEAGTDRIEIWHWFEEQNSDFLVGEVMQGIRRPQI